MPFESVKPSWQQAVQKLQADPDLSNAQVEPAFTLFSGKHSRWVVDAPRKHLMPSELPIIEPSRDLPGIIRLLWGD
jgi:hypothetical protein